MPIIGVIASSKLTATNSFESIASAAGTGSSGTITFSSIPSTYQHLQIRWSARTTSASVSVESLNIRFNSDTGSNYWHEYMYGEGTTVGDTGAAAATNAFIGGVLTNLTNSASSGVGIIDIQDYASTSKKKTFRANNGRVYQSDGRVSFILGIWNSTSAISSITIDAASSSFTTDTVFSLYGIKGA